MKLSKQDQSMIAIGAGFLIIALISKRYYFFIGTGAAVIGFVIPAWKNLLHTLWMKLSELLGWVSQRIILSLLFFFILTPLALIKKILGKDTLQIKNRSRSTTFIVRDHLVEPKELEDTW